MTSPAPETNSLDYARAVVNILEDFAEEKGRLHYTQSAILNILEDLALEKARLEQTQLEVRRSLAEKDLLLKEVHHRVKNNLQVISSLLSLQSRSVADERARGLLEDSQNRVHSIALVHEKLYRSESLARVDFTEYLESLTRHLLGTWAGGNIALHVESADVQLPIDAAIPCGLIVNELVTNALKHAFPGSRSGSIRIRAEQPQPGRFALEVRDDGIGLPEAVDVGKSGGLGFELVATLLRQLRAAVRVRREGGTAFEISFEAVT